MTHIWFSLSEEATRQTWGATETPLLIRGFGRHSLGRTA